ncbi:MAG: hypothetical protein R2688_08870 [Fimbriimonadaceae bacterium]
MPQIRIERTPVYWVFQLVIGLVRPFIVWLPVAAMTFLGGLYLHRCYEYLKDPGKPFVFQYTGAEGPITLRAEKYSLIPFPLATKLEGVSLTDDQDHLVARIDEATIRQNGKAFLIRGKKGFLDLTRDPSGMLSAQRLIPPADPNAKPTGVSAEVDEVTIRYRDETQDVPVEEEMQARDLAFSNSSEGFVAGLTVVHQAGEIDLSLLQKFQSDLEIDFRTSGFDGAQVLPTVERWVDWEALGVDPRIKASSLIFDGAGHVVVPPFDSKKPPRIYADGVFEGRGISYPGYVSSASADGEFRYADDIVSGRINLRDGATRAIFDGGVKFGEKVLAQGQFDLTTPSVTSLPADIRKLLPKDFGWRDLNAVGNITWKDNETAVEAVIKGGSLVAVGQRFDRPQGRITFAHNKLLAQIERVSYQEIPTSGWIGIDFGTEEISGKFDADSGSLLSKIPEEVRDKLIIGGETQVLLTGKFENPRFDLGFVGNGKVRLGDSGWQELGVIVAAGRLEGTTLTIDRATADGKLVGLAARGEIDIAEQTLDLEWDARGFDVKQFLSSHSEVSVGGLGYAQGTVAGSFEEPLIAGKVQVFDIENEYIEVPYITADVSFNSDQLLVTNVDAKSGMGNVEGELAFNVTTQAIDGRFSGADIFLQDIKALTGQDVVGRVQVDSATISGTLEKPIATASFFSNDLLAFGTRVDHAEAKVSFEGGVARVTEGIANIQQGVLSFDSQFDLEAQKLEGNLEATALPLGRAPISGATLTLGGNLDGTGQFKYNLESQMGEGEFDGFLDGLQVNGFDIGSGSVTAKLAENLATASATVGSIQGYVELSEAAYRLDTKEWRAKMVADGLGFSQVWVSARDKANIENAELSRLLAGLDASLGVEVIASGKEKEYQIDVPTLHAKNITSLGSQLGDLDLVGSLSPESWDLQSLTWKSDEGTITARGSRKADHTISGELDVTNFNPSILAKFDEDWPTISGNLGLTAEISGTVDDPQGQFSFSAADIAVPDKAGEIKKIPVTLNASGELANRLVTIDNGQVALQGLSGEFDARIPLDVMDDGEGEDASLQLNFTERSIEDLSDYLDVLDIKRSQGKIGGRLTAGGRKGNWEVKGDISLSGDEDGKATIAFANGDTVYENVAINVQSEGEKINISGSANSSLGGETEIAGAIDLKSILSGQITDPSFADVPITASLKLKDFNISERIRLTGVVEGKLKSVTSDKPTKSSVSGEVNIGGSLATPQISGQLNLADLEVNLPSEFPQSPAKEQSSVVPYFNDLRITAGTGSVMNIPTGDLKLSGTAIIDGPLDQVDIIAPLYVEGGSLLLPTTRVRLNEGGSVLVQAGSNVDRPRVNVDLTGTTVVTLRRSQTQFQTPTH